MKHFAIIISLLSFFTLCRAQEISKYISLNVSPGCDIYCGNTMTTDASIRYTFFGKERFEQYVGISLSNIGHSEANPVFFPSYGIRYKFSSDRMYDNYQPYIQAEYCNLLNIDSFESARVAVGVFKPSGNNRWDFSIGAYLDSRDATSFFFSAGYHFKFKKKSKEGGN